MNQQNYNCTIVVNNTPEEAFESINRVSAWWTKNLEGSSQKLHDVFTVRFGETFVTATIIESIPDKKILWHIRDCYLHWLKDKMEWKDTKISWEISNKNNSTTISMTHIGLVPEIECYQQCEKGWNFYVGESLFKLITEHEGLPEGRARARQGN
jgi:hypothetical protein